MQTDRSDQLSELEEISRICPPSDEYLTNRSAPQVDDSRNNHHKLFDCSISILNQPRKLLNPNVQNHNTRVPRNLCNLISIRCLPEDVSTTLLQKLSTLPSFGLINACSLFPKIDELTALFDNNPMRIVAITESWLHNNINRNDRLTGRGGLCVYSSLTSLA